ncbi:MAG: class I SAM-dependent methyltransferase [Pseudomonadota bacterium]|nr:class I SAM-dependent methyltransferase [Pseudomonadota bacterium]
MTDNDKRDLIQKSNEAWKKLSEWWNDDIGDGDPYHRYLIFPGMLKLVDCKPGKKILDIACGNGTLSRRFSALGAKVLGVDISETFIKQAVERSDSSIRYRTLDATSEIELAELASIEMFDSVVCSMALHDLPTITPLLQSLSSLLCSNGNFIFSIPHPCFNMGEVTLDFSSEHPCISRNSYINPVHLEMKSKRNQPINQHCFHRSLADIFHEFFSVGMVLDALLEPSVSGVKEDMSKVDLDWKYLPQIPPAMLCRFIFNKSI